MAKLLTKRKEKWVKQRNPDVIRGGVLSYNAASAMRYDAQLQAMIDKMCDQVEKEWLRFFATDHAQEYIALDASTASQARILANAMTRKFTSSWAMRSKPIAEQMANAADKSSSTQLHSSLQELSGGLSLPTATFEGPLNDIWTATVNENVSLIRSISSEYLAGVNQAVQRSITTGNGLKTLVPYLKKHKGVTQRRARTIALDQTRKAFSNLTAARMEILNVDEYEWLHMGGTREPRKLHERMSGQIYSLKNPPIIDEKTKQRGKPGDLINCKCKMRPIIKLSGAK